MRIAAALLESYERQVQSVEGALKVVTLVSPSCHPLDILLSPSCHPFVTLLLTSTYPLAPLSLHSTSSLLLVCTIDVSP